ncbi:MAG: TlpA disulfide reductase family protein [Cyclobacteriaceae bacterium]
MNLKDTFLAISLLFTMVIFGGCESPKSNDSNDVNSPRTGIWRGVILEQGEEMPFNFELLGAGPTLQMKIINATEKITVDEIEFFDDSIRFNMHIFDTEIVVKQKGDSLVGYYNKRYVDGFILPFKAKYGQDFRFEKSSSEPVIDMSGRWEVTFVTGDGKPYPAVGEFEQQRDQITGTFLTETGDYRFIEGKLDGDNLSMSTFDGNHLFLFKGMLKHDSIVNGHFWNGRDTHETWVANKNANATLTNANDLTYIKDEYDGLSFSFPDMNGDLVSLEDEKYQDKVVLVQIFGTWCPNCMDESRFLIDWHEKNKDKGVEIIGLSYEVKDDFEYAVKRLTKVKDRLGIKYDLLVAGTSDKEEAAKTLPMLNHVLSYPTLIFIDRKGEVRKIHTGFSGPGTGHYYKEFVKEFEAFTQELIDEKS